MILDLRPKVKDGRKTYFKTVAVLAVLVLFLVQILNITAWEAHVINVTAGVRNDIPSVYPDARQFCNHAPVYISLSSDVPAASIYYTLDGSDPECMAQGIEYTGEIELFETTTVKARTCHDGRQSAVVSWEFEVSDEFCDDSLLLNKVYYDVGPGRGSDSANEWIELYNPTDHDIDLGGWSYCNRVNCSKFKSGRIIKSENFALVTRYHSTADYWTIPPDVLFIDVNDYTGQPVYFANTGDLVILKNPDGEIADQMNYGEPNPAWPNYNDGTWSPGVGLAEEGQALTRIPTGHDTDTPDDWIALSMPALEILSPADCSRWWIGEEYNIEWEAMNPNGDDSELAIDIYITLDKGRTWEVVALDEANDGIFAWTVPVEFHDHGLCWLNWDKEWLKIVARGPENFLIQTTKESRHDCCQNKNQKKEEKVERGGFICQGGEVIGHCDQDKSNNKNEEDGMLEMEVNGEDNLDSQVEDEESGENEDENGEDGILNIGSDESQTDNDELDEDGDENEEDGEGENLEDGILNIEESEEGSLGKTVSSVTTKIIKTIVNIISGGENQDGED